MCSLRDLQIHFAAALFDRGATAIEASVRAQGLSATRRLNVYRNNVATLQAEALGAIYPVVGRLVGADFFSLCAHHYARQWPSVSGDLNDYGGEFPGFLREFSAAQVLPYLPDVARLEWAYHQSFHAAAQGTFPVQRLATVAPERYGELRFTLHAGVCRLSSTFPVLAIWEANQVTCAEVPAVTLDQAGDRLLVLRRELDIEFLRLGVGEYAFVDAMAGGATFDIVCAGALDADPDLDIQRFLAFCIQRGVIADFAEEMV